MSAPSTATLCFSLGDPNGVGAEVLLKALAFLGSESGLRPVISGDSKFLRALADDFQISIDWEWLRFLPCEPWPYPPKWGAIQAHAGKSAIDSLQRAIEFCKSESCKLLVTAPLHKEAAHLSGFDLPGQTELLASHFPGCDATMAFFSDRLNVLLATVHIPLREVPRRLTVELLISRGSLFFAALSRMQESPPRVGVCGLNPHASEGGRFGDEEERIIQPAVVALQQKFGAEAFTGPYPGDTLFRRAFQGEFDGVVALYHDQGLAPLKLVAFDSAVNTTLGLPIVRTSPDHGTAFDIAGRGESDPASMIAAIRWGLRLASSSE